MEVPERDELEQPGEQDAHEGVFDAQLSFPAPFIEAPQPVQSIIKRDGREAPFEKAKIAEAIFKAAESIGGSDRDRAHSLASGVAIYLMKLLKGAPPTVDQVNDAVEKVLIEMGHARTALAYARFRDRRARIRKLREGDTRTILNELAEARREDVAQAALQGERLVVRTSAETLDGWKRERIVEALVRETGLEEATANLIAFEVEQQILSARIAVLTTPLVRELVDAKLAEHGLEAYRKRHMRLGVPLYDAERIVAGAAYVDQGPLDPERTDLLLAERVKKEYALSQVFSQEVADAHLKGELHLHDLGHIDRLYGAIHSPAAAQLFGNDLRGGGKEARLPRTAEALIRDVGLLQQELRAYFTNVLGWEAANVFFAPFVLGGDKRYMSHIAHALVTECGERTGPGGPEAVLHVSWDVPAWLQAREALGAAGAYMGRCYHDYQETAKSLAWAMVDACRECSERRLPVPTLAVAISGPFFRSHGYEAFLTHVAGLVAQNGKVRINLVRKEGPGGGEPLWAPRTAIVHYATINLPHSARSGAESTAFDELARLVAIAAAAHRQKASFIRRLAALRDLGPLAALTVEREGRPYLDFTEPRCCLGVAGLNEAVQRLCGAQLHESEEARALAARLLEHIEALCANARESEGLDIRLSEGADPAVCRRLSELDGDGDGDGSPYTPGARTAASAPLSPMERLRIEGRFHRLLGDGAVAGVSVPDIDTSKVSIAQFIKKAYRQTAATGLVVSL